MSGHHHSPENSEMGELHVVHDYLGASHDRNARRTLWVVVLTLVMMVAEIAAGVVTGSMALLADGFHMATHAGALGVAALAYGYARKHVHDPRYSFGTGKVGDLAGFASALALGIFALGIAWESLVRLANPVSVQFDEAILVAVVGLLVNVVSAWLLAGGGGHSHGHDHGHGHAHEDGHVHHGVHDHGTDNNMRAAYIHVLADALTSVMAIAALVAGRFLGWVWLDPVIGIVGALVIARWAWSLMKGTAAILLDVADPVLLARVREAVEGPGDTRIHDVHVWQVGPASYAAIVEVHGNVDCAAIRARLKPIANIAHLTVEVRRD